MKRRETIKLITGISWRNVWRNKRRSFLTFLTIMAGCTMILFMRSMQNGAFAMMIEDGVSLLSGHIQIHEMGFWKNNTLEYTFRDDPSIIAFVRGMPQVKEVSRRIDAAGLIVCKNSSASAEILGIEPGREKDIITLDKYILPGGRFIKDGDGRSIVLGDVLAGKIGVKTGSIISLVSQGFDGSIAADYFTVTGIFRSPDVSYNKNIALIPFDQADKTFTMSGYVSSYVIRLHDTETAEYVRDMIRVSVPGELEVLAWDELMPQIIQFIVLKRFSSYMFLFIMYLIVAFGVLNTMQTAVYERTREFGIMLSLGTGSSRVLAVVMTEAIIIALIGIAAGLLSGFALSYYFTVHPIDISGYRDVVELYNVSIMRYYAKIEGIDFLLSAFVILVFTVTFTFFPARRASRLDPVKAIRHL